MRAFLVFVILILLGLLGATWHFKTRPTEAHRGIIAELKEELAAAEREQAELRTELSRTRTELAASKAQSSKPASAPSFAASPSVSSAPPPSSPAPPTPPTTGIDARLAQLRAIYDSNLRALEADRDKATLAIRTAQEQREHLRRNPPKFSEQTQITAVDGSFAGNRGVRTSDADRNRAEALHRQESERLNQTILENEQKLKEIDQRRARLDEQYRNAVEKAKSGKP